MMMIKKFPMVNNLFLMLLCLLSVSVMSAQDKSAAALYNEGLALLKKKDYEQGFELMEEAMESAEENNDEKVLALAKKNGAIAAYNYGNSLRKNKNSEEAETYYQKGIEMNPDYAPNYLGHAMALKDNGENDEAMKAFMISANKYEMTNQDAKVKQVYKQAMVLIGRLYTSDQFLDAIKTGETYFAQNEDKDVAYYIGRSYEKTGDFNKALTYMESCLKLAGDDTQDKYFVGHAAALEGLNKIPEAIEAYQKITEEKYKELAEYKIKSLSN